MCRDTVHVVAPSSSQGLIGKVPFFIPHPLYFRSPVNVVGGTKVYTQPTIVYLQNNFTVAHVHHLQVFFDSTNLTTQLHQ